MDKLIKIGMKNQVNQNTYSELGVFDFSFALIKIKSHQAIWFNKSLSTPKCFYTSSSSVWQPLFCVQISDTLNSCRKVMSVDLKIKKWKQKTKINRRIYIVHITKNYDVLQESFKHQSIEFSLNRWYNCHIDYFQDRHKE